MFKIYDTMHRYLFGFMLASLAVSFASCGDDKEVTDTGYDPSKPVSITKFVPETGGVGQQLVIYGENFGNDTANVKVTIGGKKAVLVSVSNTALYCYVPSGAYTGEIVVTVGKDGQSRTAEAATVFNYERKMVVGTLCGYRNERDDQGWVDGSFDICAGFRQDGVMQFSPYNHDQLFIVHDNQAHGIQLVDLKERTLSTVLPLSKFNNQRLRTVDFAVDPYAYTESGVITGYSDDVWEAAASAKQLAWKEHLIIAADNYDSNYRANSVYIVDRDPTGEFSSNSTVRALANYNQCNGASLHPNGELYFTSYTQGKIMRLDMDKYWETLMTGETWSPYATENMNGEGTDAFEELFRVQDNGWEMQIDIHPSGKYAYIVIINKHYICRTDYNETTKKFSPPYVIAGAMKTSGFTDGVGKSALLNRPYQGTFVKNDEYEKDGKDDIYDFYFCDCDNNAVRYLTPEGIVYTYAGGGASTHADGHTYGNENGELRDVARFDGPTGLVSDTHVDGISGENTLIFYILDRDNRCIRTITMEESEDTSDDSGSSETTESKRKTTKK